MSGPLLKSWTENRVSTGRALAGMAGAGGVGAGLVVLANAISTGGADAGDWLQFFGGMLGAGLAVVGAYVLDFVRRDAEDRRAKGAAIEELLRAYRSAETLFLKAARIFPRENWKSLSALSLKVEAEMVLRTLDRLLTRTHLTDGAVSVGCGGIALMQTVIDAALLFEADNGVDIGPRAKKRLTPGMLLAAEIRERYNGVAEYGVEQGYLNAVDVSFPVSDDDADPAVST